MSGKINRSIALTAALFVLGHVLAAGAAFAQDGASAGSAPISILRIGADDPAILGFRPRRPAHIDPAPSSGTTFLVTNQTSSTVVVNLTGIEVRTGSNWTTQLRPHGPLILSAPALLRTGGTTNAFMPGMTTTGLGPHQAAYATIQFSGTSMAVGAVAGSIPGPGMNYLAGQPTGSVWRVNVSVQEKLTGLADASARIIRYPDTQFRLAASGVTNAPINPFSGAYSYFGKPMRVVSQEVPAQ